MSVPLLIAHSPGATGELGVAYVPPQTLVIVCHVSDPDGLYPTVPVTPASSIVTGLSKTKVPSGEPTEMTVLPTLNPAGALPLDVSATGGVILPSHPAGP